MDILGISLYSLFTVIQIFLYLSVGIISYYKKIYTSKSLKSLSMLIINFFLPMQGMLEISRMASLDNIVQLWILVFSVCFSILIGYICGRIYCFVFKFDLRMKNIYSFILGIPSIGTLSLVLGRAFCFPGGPLEGDDKCPNMLGYMKFNSLVFTLILYIAGFSLIAKDSEYSNKMDQIMAYSWPSLCERIYNGNYFVAYVLQEFTKDKKLAAEQFKEFESRYKLKKLDGQYKFILIETEHDNLEKNKDQLEKAKVKIDNKQSSNKNIEKTKAINQAFVPKQIKNENDHVNKFKGIQDNIADLNVINEDLSKKLYQSHLMQIPEIYSLNAELDFAENNIFNVFKNNKTLKSKLVNENKEKINEKVNLTFNNNHVNEFNESEKDIEKGLFINKSDVARFTNNYNNHLKISSVDKKNTSTEKVDRDKADIIKEKSIYNKFKQNETNKDIYIYFSLLFKTVEEDLLASKQAEFEELKNSIFSNISNIPIKFPTIRGVVLNRNNESVINQIYLEEYLPSILQLNEKFVLKKPEKSVNLNLIINLIYSPPVIGCLIGILIGISNLREILFSKNHYISSIVEGWEMVSKISVPFLYVTVGLSFVVIPGLNLNMTVRKVHVYLGIFHRFVVMPSIGIIWVYLWKIYFGSYVKDSRVIRIAMFIPFCVPSGANIVMLVNIMKYYINETSALLVAQNIAMIFTLTIWYLIYFISIGYEI